MAIIGMGPRIGVSLAHKFGREGYRIGLVSRNQKSLDKYVKELANLGIESVGFAADVHDRPGLQSAIEKIVEHFGPIDVLEYSPMLDDYSLVDVMRLDVENAQYQLDMQLHGAITAVRTVVNDMIKKGDGALLFTLGVTANLPGPSHSNGAIGVAALRHYAIMLNMTLKFKGIYVGTISIGKDHIGDEIADIYWEKMHKRESCETIYGDPRIHGAYEVLTAMGIGQIFPPRLTGVLPKPQNEKERHTFLVALNHAADCARLLGAEGPAEIRRLEELAKAIGGDINAEFWGGDLDQCFPPMVTF
ncbi:NAD(P)-binding protein [Lepidopterella palustris CBS 459.81]|uniref:NAD(P)-binding protein n=1 Tax=Lepidopterella palustris CBS 459.81 TaxID=1314670 RepID=A0A8E2DWG5_9PEZI|nr:NAD(P)-binding protein [Lepidopterella palustris CBS 459.81]